MGRKWGNKQWYEYHKSKAAEAGVQIYAASEKNALDAIDKKISELQKKLEQLSATISGLSGLISILVPNQTTREISVIRKSLEDLYFQRSTLHLAAREKIEKAAARGINEYHIKREIRADEEIAAAKEKRIRYLERSPAIRSAQSAIKEHLIAKHLETGPIICYYCNVSLEPEEVQIEHKLPVVRGGTNSRKNLELACSTCNLRKGTKTEPEFRRYLEQKR
jgi:5-methylcytosine-specific restriction endonuclease McrA